jgi:hypothetical protein
MRHSSLAIVTAFSVTSLVIAAPARADRKSVSVTLTGDIAATDNVFATTADRNEGDLFLTIRPGILLGYNRPRMIHELAFEGEVINFLLHSDAPALSLRAAVTSSYVTSKYTQLTTAFNASNGVITALSSRLTPDQTGPQVQPIGRVDSVNGDASAAFTWNSGKGFSFGPRVFARASRTDDNADDVSLGATEATIIRSAEAGGALGFQKTFRRGDSLAAQAGASVLRLERDAPLDAMLGPRLDRQINPRANVQWRHDFDRVWAMALDAGAVYVYPYKEDPNNPGRKDENRGLYPVAGATGSYTEVWGRAQLQVRRDVAPNLLVAQNTISDSAVASVTMPLPMLDQANRSRPRFVGLGSFGLSRTTLLDQDTSAQRSQFENARLDVGIGYTPRPGFTYGVRYEFIYQTGDDNAVMQIPGFFRNTLYFTFAIRYPEDVAGRDRQRRGNGVRADGSDLVPIGVDPTPGDLGGIGGRAD